MWLWSCLLVAFVTANMADGEADGLNRQERNSLQLCALINRHISDRNCLAYLTYGCFCGLRSWGSYPVDESDSCCRQHDRCFASLSRDGCENLLFTTYDYSCSGSTHVSCQCTDSDTSSCEYRSCQCDVQLARCLGGVSSSYDSKYFRYGKSNCE